jgi:hypothetical protein
MRRSCGAFAFLTAAGLSTAAIAADVHPIVEADTGYFFGASASGKWIKADQAAKQISGETAYRLYGLTRAAGEAKGSKPQSIDEPCPDTCGVKFSKEVKERLIALAAPWNPLPRKAQVLANTQPAYMDAARDFLKSRGIKDPVVKITRILRLDLEGDGEEEVLLSATNYHTRDEGVPTSAKLGSYSFVILRRVVAGQVQTQLVAGEFYTKATTFSAPNYYEISGVLDLNGDGKLEVVVRSGYYEGGATTIYEITQGKLKPVLAVDCGV